MYRFFFIVVFFLSIFHNQIFAQETDPAGIWDISKAETLSGETYTGTVKIEKVQDVYKLTWTTSAGNYTGLGFWAQNQLLVGWGLEGTFGVALFGMEKIGQLTSIWTTSELNGALGKEIATSTTTQSILGNYDIDGTNPNKQGTYEGHLIIRKFQGIYKLTWKVGDNQYAGVGLGGDDWIVAGWGEDKRYGVGIYQLENGRLVGKWAIPDQYATGTEVLSKKNR